MQMFSGGGPQRTESPVFELTRRIGLVAELLVDGNCSAQQAELDAASKDAGEAKAKSEVLTRYIQTVAAMLGMTKEQAASGNDAVCQWLHERCQQLRSAGERVPKNDRRENVVDALMRVPDELEGLRAKGDATEVNTKLFQIMSLVERYGDGGVVERVSSALTVLKNEQQKSARIEKNLETSREKCMLMASGQQQIAAALGVGTGAQAVEAIGPFMTEIREATGVSEDAELADLAEAVKKECASDHIQGIASTFGLIDYPDDIVASEVAAFMSNLRGAASAYELTIPGLVDEVRRLKALDAAPPAATSGGDLDF